jgi:hypothetical protein
VYEKVCLDKLSNLPPMLIANFLIHLVINSFIMKLKDIKYLTKLMIAYPTALLLGIIGYKKGFDKMIIWLNKGS